MSDDKYLRRLRIIGITSSPSQNGVYGIVLQDEESHQRIPIAIGQSEAQAIQCRLQDIITPRPLTHDIITNIMRAFGVNIKSILIKRTSNGIFTADISLTDGTRSIVLDARSSDAIALAIRFGAPIFTTADLLDSLASSTISSASQSVETSKGTTMLSGIPDQQLKDMLSKAIEKEQYEMAQRIKEELDKRNNEA